MLINVIFFVTLIPFLWVSMKWLSKEMLEEFKKMED